MSVYAVFDANGRNPAFYVVGLNCDAPPAGSVEITEAERDAWVANPGAFRWDGSQIVAYAPPVEPAPPITQVNFLGFLALFTPTEQAAIVNSMDPRIKLFCLMAAGASAVDLTDPRTVSGTNLLESLGLIAKGRATQVLAGQAPPTS